MQLQVGAVVGGKATLSTLVEGVFSSVRTHEVLPHVGDATEPLLALGTRVGLLPRMHHGVFLQEPHLTRLVAALVACESLLLVHNRMSVNSKIA